MQRAIDRVLEALQPYGVKPMPAGGWTARCPAHDDKEPSLKVDYNEAERRVLIHCHAGCYYEDVLEAIGMINSDLFDPDVEHHIVAVYKYHDEDGVVLHETVRYQPKRFLQRHPDSNGGYVWNLNGCRRVLYRLPELLAAPLNRMVYLCEGEKDADNLAKLGKLATTNPMGGKHWRPEFTELLRGRLVTILPDHDQTGYEHAEAVARQLQGVAAQVKVLALPRVEADKDVSDWIAGGGTAEQLAELARQCPVWTPNGKTTLDELNEENEVNAEDRVGAYFLRFNRLIRSRSTFSGPMFFPLQAVPESVRRLAEEAHEKSPFHRDYVACACLNAIGVVLGNQTELVYTWQWRERTVLWSILIGATNEKKSPAMKLAFLPLRKLQLEERERYDREVAAWQKGQPEPYLRRYWANDVTMEAVAAICQHNPALGLVYDEARSWMNQMDMYRQGKGDDRQKWLQSFSLESFRVERKGALKAPIDVRRPHICVCGAVVPMSLRTMIGEMEAGEGLLGRIAFTWPSSLKDHPPRDSITPGVTGDWEELIRELDRYRGEQIEEVFLELQAQRLYEAWYEANRDLMETATEAVKAVYGKLYQIALRYALVLHAAEHPTRWQRPRISVQTMANALRIVEYHRCHAHRVLNHLGVQHVGAKEQRLWDALWSNFGEWVDTTTLINALGRNVSAAEVRALLSPWVEINRVEYQNPKYGSRGRPSQLWRPTAPMDELNELNEVNPAIDVDALVAGLSKEQEF